MRKPGRWWSFATLALCSVLALARTPLEDGAGDARATPPGDAAPVMQLQDGLMALAMSERPADTKERVRALLLATHDMEHIARIVLGRHWRALGPPMQEAFLSRFTDLSVASFAARFRSAAGARFEIETAAGPALSDGQVVSILHTVTGETHRFEYLLRHDERQWRIVNIIVDGVSDLALKRAEYARLIRDGGFTALDRALEEQITALDSGLSAQPDPAGG